MRGRADAKAVAIGEFRLDSASARASIAASTTQLSISAKNADLDLAQRNGFFRLGAVSLSRLSLSLDLGGIPLPPGFSADIKTDTGSASFLKYVPANLIATSGQVGYTTIGSCVVSFDSGSSSVPVDPVQPDGLDAGPAIRVTGPKGAKDMTTTAGTKGYYSASLSGSNPLSSTPYLDPGAYTISGTGGADVGQFNVTVNLPAALNWANQSAITTVTRAQGVTVNWTGGDPASYVSIIGSSSAPNSKPTATFYCIERVSANQFTVPPAVLLALPPTPPSSGSDLGGGFLMVGSSGQYGTFTANGLDKGYVAASSVSGKTVTYK